MSQQGVERAVGKLVTDEEFRNAFFRDPERASLRAGIDLSPEEMDALSQAPRGVVGALGAQLDGRICRIHVLDEAE